jgi:hypothetical protein
VTEFVRWQKDTLSAGCCAAIGGAVVVVCPADAVVVVCSDDVVVVCSAGVVVVSEVDGATVVVDDGGTVGAVAGCAAASDTPSPQTRNVTTTAPTTRSRCIRGSIGSGARPLRPSRTDDAGPHHRAVARW